MASSTATLDTNADFSASLRVAAMRASHHGASQAQVNYIISLTDTPDMRDVPSVLTKKAASAWIDRLLNPVVIPAYVAPTAEEVAAEKEENARREARGADLAARKDAWIKSNYPDYAERSTKSRKRIRHTANKAIK